MALDLEPFTNSLVSHSMLFSVWQADLPHRSCPPIIMIISYLSFWIQCGFTLSLSSTDVLCRSPHYFCHSLIFIVQLYSCSLLSSQFCPFPIVFFPSTVREGWVILMQPSRLCRRTPILPLHVETIVS